MQFPFDVYDHTILELERNQMFGILNLQEEYQTSLETIANDAFKEELSEETLQEYAKLTKIFNECKETIQQIYSEQRYNKIKTWTATFTNCPEPVIYALLGNLQARQFTVGYFCEKKKRNYIQRFTMTYQEKELIQFNDKKSVAHYLQHMVRESKEIVERKAKSRSNKVKGTDSRAFA